MTKNMKLLLPLVMVLQAGLPLTSSCKSNQPIGSSNAIGSVSNSNVNLNSLSNGTSTSSSNSNSTNIILLPNGTRRSTSISTITVCDDFGGIFQNEVDVCSFR